MNKKEQILISGCIETTVQLLNNYFSLFEQLNCGDGCNFTDNPTIDLGKPCACLIHLPKKQRQKMVLFFDFWQESENNIAEILK